jgi:2-polyprenyl-6-methoxyphenol hydroxylase-like FAD-dependent oxidoreductase
MAKSAIIVGGGIAGLSAGIALRKSGYEVTLFEQAPSLEPIGAALSIWGNAMAGLDWLGCGDAVRERSHPMNRLRLTRPDGRALWGPVDVAESDSWLPVRASCKPRCSPRWEPTAAALAFASMRPKNMAERSSHLPRAVRAPKRIWQSWPTASSRRSAPR